MAIGDRKKILMAVPAYFPRMGGIETLIANLGETLKDSREWEISVIAPALPGERPFEVTVGGLQVFSVELFEISDPTPAAIKMSSIFSSCREIFRRVQPDLIHFHWNSALFAPLLAVARRLEVPRIIHLHGELTPDLPAHFVSAVKDEKEVMANSQFVAKSAVQASGRKKPPTVIYNGLTPLPLRQSYEANAIAVMIGRLEKNKGFAEALLEFLPLFSEFPKLCVHIYGQGAERKHLETLISTHSLSERVVLKGETSRGEVLRAIRECQLVVVPSVAIEGFSLVALEAAFSGTPCVAYATGGIPEVVVSDETGILAAPSTPGSLATATRRVLASPELGHRLGTSGRRRATRKFGIEAMARQITSEYARILNQHTPGRPD